MDPFTILGVACNIWTFVEVGIKVLKTTNDMYSKGSGTTQDASTIEESIGVMKQSIDALKSSEGPQELQLLSQQCQALSRQLFKILAKLKITNKKSRLQYFKVVWISTWNASKIATIETKLSNMRSVLTMYQLTLMNEKASVFKRKLDKIEAGVDALSIERGHELARQRTDIIALLESRCTEDVAKKLRVMEESMRVSEVETKILNQLRFSALKRREDGIEDAKHGTYAWILKRSKGETNLMKEIRKTFASWLKFEAGVFHISGKPGAGKSTLMKFIATHPETRRHVEQTWAKGTDLCYASFFFYNAGGEDEKSLEGLYRSILYTVLNDCPGLMPTVFPDFFRRDELVQERLLLDITRPQQIRNTFQKFINIATGGKYKICLFIDGLDEYKGDATEHRNLAEQLRSWAANSEGHVKFCVSSRPHVQFTQTFAPSGSLARQIHLHELTRNDIARHCLSAFQGDTQYHRLPALQSECNALVEAIADRAEGVFLWAHFVVRFVLEEAKQEGTRDDLWRRLDEIPEKIDDLYDQLLGSLKKQDRLVANQMLMAVLTNPFKDSLNIMCLKWLKEGKKWDKFPLETYRHDQRQARDAVESAINHLNGWTRGLIELEFKKKRKTVRGREYDTSSTDSEISSSSVECSMRSMRQTSSEASHSAERMKPLTVVGPEDDRLRIPVEAPEPTSPSHPDECYIITDPSWQPPSQQRDSKSVVGHGESTSSLAQSSTQDGPPPKNKRRTKRVKLFHKTVKDYLFQTRIAELVSSLDNLDIGEFHAMMRLAEIQYQTSSIDRPISNLRYGYEILGIQYGYEILRIFDKSFGVNPVIGWPIFDTLCSLLPTESFFPLEYSVYAQNPLINTLGGPLLQSCQQTSKPHFAAFLGLVSSVEFAKSAKEPVRATSQRPHPRPKARNMLLSASLGRILLYPYHGERLEEVDTIGFLIKSGFSGHDQVQLLPSALQLNTTVWSIVVSRLLTVRSYTWLRQMDNCQEEILYHIFSVLVKLLQHEKQEEILLMGFSERDERGVLTYTCFFPLKEVIIYAIGQTDLDPDNLMLHAVSSWADYTETQPDWIHQWEQHTRFGFAKTFRKVSSTEVKSFELSLTVKFNAVVTRNSFLELDHKNNPLVQVW